MPDPRFFEDLGPVELSELAGLTGARLADPGAASRTIRSVSVLAAATADSITFVSDSSYLDQLRTTAAAAWASRAKRRLAPALVAQWGCRTLTAT